MSFLHRIQEELKNPRNGVGHRNRVMVPARELYELLDDYEKLDAAYRAFSIADGDPNSSNDFRLDILLTHLFHQDGRKVEPVLRKIMRTLTTLSDREEKRQAAKIMQTRH